MPERVPGALSELSRRGLNNRREVRAAVVSNERERVEDRPRGRELAAPERSPTHAGESRENRRDGHTGIEFAAPAAGGRLGGGVGRDGSANSCLGGGDEFGALVGGPHGGAHAFASIMYRIATVM